MRTVISTLVAICGAVLVSGCGGDGKTSRTTDDVDARAPAQHDSATPATAAEEHTGPTIFGVDSALQQEMRRLIARFIEEQNLPGDPADNLAKAFDSAMLRLRRPAEEFGLEADASGNIEWPEQVENEMVKPLRAKFDAGELFNSYEIDLPVWAGSLLEEYNAGNIAPARRELLFRLASADIIKDMT